MSTFNFTLPGGKAFNLKGPEGMSFEQAQAIFEQQSSSGSLVGVKVGGALSAATQSVGGLDAAKSQLTQGLGSIAGAVGAGTNLSSLTSSLGPLGAAAAGQAISALAGGAAAFNSLTSGASAATGAISAGLSIATGAAGIVAGGAGAITGALTGVAAQVGSVANTAIKTVIGALGQNPISGIGIADFAKQAPALAGLGSMSLPDVTATLAQASKLVGQASDVVSNVLGAGKFGFNATQLERTGLIKPGTAAAFLAAGTAELVDVLKSPTVWTGKDGVKGLDGLLGNTGLQDKLQQNLMADGIGALKQAGLPIDKLNPQALAGVATIAAKSVGDALAWAKGSASLPAGVKASFDSTVTNSAFAVNLTQTKVDESLLKEKVIEPASNTVNTESATAAATRVVGNDKVPSMSASSGDNSAKNTVIAGLEFLQSIAAQAEGLNATVQKLKDQSSITQDQWNAVNEELQIIRATYNSKVAGYQSDAVDAVNALPDSNPQKALLAGSVKKFQALIKRFVQSAVELKKDIADLANKIVT